MLDQSLIDDDDVDAYMAFERKDLDTLGCDGKLVSTTSVRSCS
jgi:hypothetical protein